MDREPTPVTGFGRCDVCEKREAVSSREGQFSSRYGGHYVFRLELCRPCADRLHGNDEGAGRKVKALMDRQDEEQHRRGADR